MAIDFYKPKLIYLRNELLALRRKSSVHLPDEVRWLYHGCVTVSSLPNKIDELPVLVKNANATRTPSSIPRTILQPRDQAKNASVKYTVNETVAEKNPSYQNTFANQVLFQAHIIPYHL